MEELISTEYAPQKSAKWFQARSSIITASDVGALLGVCRYNNFLDIILKKIGSSTFIPNINCYHGTKYEKIAALIYEKRNEVRLSDIGLVIHKEHNFLGASPDGICSGGKPDFIGRLLEIKCPYTRKIRATGKTCGDIISETYWCQMQLQLECCGLNKCDFFQCKISEYGNREKFLADAGLDDKTKSEEFGAERGCIIETLPLCFANSVLSDDESDARQTIYYHASFVYPSNISKTSEEWDEWIGMNVAKITENTHKNKVFVHRVIYWRLEQSLCTHVERDTKWLTNCLPKLQKVAGYIKFLTNRDDKSRLLASYLNLYKSGGGRDIGHVEMIVRIFCNERAKSYDSNMRKISKQVRTRKIKACKTTNDSLSGYCFNDI